MILAARSILDDLIRMIFKDKNFNEVLQESLEQYTSFNDDIADSQNIFSLNREIAIARFALSKQAEAYATAVSILTSLLESVTLSNSENAANILNSILFHITQIEAKSQALIDSVQKVTNLVGTVINLDVDKAALRNMIINLPSLVKDAVTNVSKDPTLADKISASLDSRLSNMLIAFRFDSAGSTISQEPQGIILEQYTNMVNSVPTQPSN